MSINEETEVAVSDGIPDSVSDEDSSLSPFSEDNLLGPNELERELVSETPKSASLPSKKSKKHGKKNTVNMKPKSKTNPTQLIKKVKDPKKVKGVPVTKNAKPKNGNESGKVNKTKDMTPSPNETATLLRWDIKNVVNDEGGFLSRSKMMRKMPELIIEGEDAKVAFIITPKIASQMHIAFRSIDNVFQGKPAVSVKRNHSFNSAYNSVVNWWLEHKVKGTILGALGAFVLITFLSGLIRLSA